MTDLPSWSRMMRFWIKRLWDAVLAVGGSGRPSSQGANEKRPSRRGHDRFSFWPRIHAFGDVWRANNGQ